MSRKIILYLMLSVITSLNGLQTAAQKTSVFEIPLLLYQDGQELFNKEKYCAAQETYQQIIETRNAPAEMKANAEYYQAVCALMLFHNDAENLANDFIKSHPENPKVNHTHFLLGNFYFKNKKYKDALESYKNVEITSLNADELSEYHFKTGYSYFTQEQYTEAKKSFFEIINKESRYFAPANYYFAHIAYIEKNYETALKAFNKLLSDENYGKIAPYYLIQIYYYQKKYEEIIILAPALLDSASSKRVPELARITAEAYYQTERYAEAFPFIDTYLQKNTLPLSRNDYYMLGFTYYKVNDCKKAISYFSKVSTSSEDSLSQLTYYHLAECYLKSGDKQFAMNMFASAYKINNDNQVQENAMFNYAKLAYETAYNPYNEAIKAFEQYIEKYPNSANIDEAYEYMSSIYLSTKNYKDALESLEKIKRRNYTLNTAYQKIAYFRGIELFNNNDFEGAITHLSKSLEFPLNNNIELLSYFWTAEAFYRQEKFDSAIVNYKLMQSVTGAASNQANINSYYGLGYCYFKKKNYGTALSNFRKFVSEYQGKNKEQLNDAYNRTGDCYFMEKNFNEAIENYDAALNLKLLDADYALYQKSLAQGALSKFEVKATTLISLIEGYKKSEYRAAAIFQLAMTYQHMNNNSKAVDYYDKLIREYPNSGFISQALLKKGMIYYNESKDQQALAVLKKVVNDYPGTTESKEALLGIRNIFVDMDNVDEFFKYVKDLPFVNVSDSEQDSITYIAIENRYMKNDCVNAIKGFKDYIQKFPEGVYRLDAHFYLAECLYRTGLKTESLSNYDYVISKPRNKFTETSLLTSAEINFENRNYQAALAQFTELEKYSEYKENIITAIAGQMRCSYYTDLFKSAIDNARRLQKKEKISETLTVESHMIIARSALAIDSVSLAMAELNVVCKITKSEAAAEARYLLGEIYYKIGNYTESEKAAFDLINQIPSYDYWVAKAFILLADNYLKQGNIHQAKYTLKSIIDNYEGADLIQIAQEKYNAIITAEQLEEQKKAEELLKNRENTEPIDDNNILK